MILIFLKLSFSLAHLPSQFIKAKLLIYLRVGLVDVDAGEIILQNIIPVPTVVGGEIQ